MPPGFDAPVLLVAFNRPDVTRRTLAGIRAVAPRRLFLAVDGPRPGRPDDIEGCAAVRRELETIDWDCQVERHYAESNRGCNGNVELALDWVFGSVDQAIILEDDCLPDPTFFRFCAELLERYRDDDRIWQIGGTSFEVPTEHFGGDSYGFSGLAAIWGWATWSRAWQAHRMVLTRDHATSGCGRTMAPERSARMVYPPGTFQTAAGFRILTEVAESTDGQMFSWDSHWWASLNAHGGLAISPSVNMVENIGYGADATHTQCDQAMPKAEPMSFPLKHPESVTVNERVATHLETMLVPAIGGVAWKARVFGYRLRRRLARRVSYRIRQVVRAVAKLGEHMRQRLAEPPAHRNE